MSGAGAAQARQRVAVIGQGYVGLPLAMLAVQAGYDVTGIDLDGSRVACLLAGQSYVDDVSAGQLREALGTGRYAASTNYSAAAGFAVALLSVPTPLQDRSPDLSFVIGAGRQLAPYLTRGSVVVLESTTYPGTTEDLLRPVLEQGSGLRAGADFALGYSPERVDPGNRTWTITSTP
jgi:UDP-N-acetyl-D-glucosamine dehydrogenase